MKAVYTRRIDIEIILNDDTKVIVKSDFLSGRYIYLYGEFPDEHFESFNIYGKCSKDVKELCDKYHNLLENYKGGLFKKEHYIKARTSYYNWITIPINNIKFINIKKYCKAIENPKIKWLEEDLGFKGYSELVFDREQELKSLLLKGWTWDKYTILELL